jgi:NodT family efflux transporter outer membrane factor (OMF) lipoprotein
MRNAFTISISAAAAALLAGCMVGPDYKEPQSDVPASWTEESAGAAADGAWWRSFNDPELDSLIRRAASANTDVRVALARLREARAQRGAVKAALLPRVDMNASYSNSRFSENGFLKGFGSDTSSTGGGAGGLPGAVGPGQEINLYQVGLDASWEIDIFGGQRRAVEAATAELAAAAYDAGDVLRSVQAEVADGYVQLRGLQERLGVAQRTAESQRKSLEIVREQHSKGVASDLDLSRAESQAATANAALPDLEGAARVGVRRLEVLLGVKPGTLDAELQTSGPIPAAPDALNAGIPSETLRRRPDIRAAERRLAAETARIGVATADLFPRFSLTGSFGLQSQKLDELPDGDSRFWAIGPTVRWPILDFGRISSNIEVHNARQEAAAAEYEGAVLRALSDVEIAMVRLSRERRRSVELDKAAAAADKSVAVAEDLYKNGLLEYTDLLDVQRTQYAASDAAAMSRTAVASDSVGLFKALGGGWSDAIEVEEDTGDARPGE